MSRRFLFVRLPAFPSERFSNSERQTDPTSKPWWDEQADQTTTSESAPLPLVLVDHGPKGTRISASSQEAMALGLWPDMKLADARTMVPELRVEQHNRQADQSVLKRLARWLTRYSPAVAESGDDGFALDITGCAHLLGGENALAHDITNRLNGLGFTAIVAVADTLAASLALVMHGRECINILPKGHGPNFLDSLPVEALRLDGDTLILLKRLGLKQIGDVRRIPRAALERRFQKGRTKGAKNLTHTAAQSVQMRLDQLSGALAEPQKWLSELQTFRAVLQCPDFALDLEAVGIALDRLLPGLCQQLSEASSGGRHFILNAYRADGGVSTADVRLSQPMRDPAAIRRLFRDRLEAINCGFGIDLFVLSANNVEPIHTRQNEMMGGQHAIKDRVSLIAFADTIANRVGHPAVMRFAPHKSHVPERAQRAVPMAFKPNWTAFTVEKPIQSPRPLRLLERPEVAQVTADLPDGPPAQFLWRKVLRRVIRARGPERILPEWWHDSLKVKPSALLRDYYDVEDSEGRRYWLFRSVKDIAVDAEADTKDGASEPSTIRTNQWFVHGLF